MESISEPGWSQDGLPASTEGTSSSRKRSRDHGEVLKGLTPNRDSDGEASNSSTSKRVKLGNEDERADVDESADRAAVGSHEDDKARLQIANGEDDADVSIPTSQKGWNRGVSLAQRTSFGGGSKAKTMPSASSAGGLASQSNTARSSDELSPHNVEPPDGEDEDDASEGEVSKPSSPPNAPGTTQGAGSEPRPLIFKIYKQEWALPSKTFARVKCRRGEELQAPYWTKFLSENLEKLIDLIIKSNQDKKKDIDRDVVLAAFSALLKPGNGFLVGAKDKKKTAKAAAFSAFSKLQTSMLNDILSQRGISKKGSRSSGVVSPAQNGIPQDAGPFNEDQQDKAEIGVLKDEAKTSTVAEDRDLDDHADDMHRQHALYFPSADDAPMNCLHCARTSHQSDECPELACHFCGSESHSRFGCPTKQRCSKCHQIGHPMTSCTEKLSLARAEWPPCVFCGADHLEEACNELVRSYYPPDSGSKKVQEIARFCYHCGALGHYGPECMVKGSTAPTAGHTSWSKSNRDLYVDATSTDVALAVASGLADFGQVEPDFHIRGHAKRPTHVYVISSDDESEGDFLKPPVPKQKRPGDIRIASNISQGTQQSGGRARKQSNRRQNERDFSPPPPPPHGYAGNGNRNGWQPPLPPGPPPPSNGYGGNGTGPGHGWQPPVPPGPPPPNNNRHGGSRHQQQQGPRHHGNSRQNNRAGRGGGGGGGGRGGGGSRGKGRR
jgi:protein AIR1/2